MTDSDTPPKYDIKTLEAVVLEIAAELHPELLSARGLTLRIVSNRDDDREVGTATGAICNLRESGLFCDRDDEVIELTPAVLRAVALLT